MTGRAEIGAGPAGQAFLMNRVPEGMLKIHIQDRFDGFDRNVGFDLLAGFFGNGLLRDERLFVRLGRLGKITQEFLAFGCNEFGQIVRADLRQQNIRAL